MAATYIVLCRMKFHEHPLNTEISNFQAWLWTKVDEKRLTLDENAAIVRAGNVVFQQSGLPNGPELSDLTLAVFRQQLHVLKTKAVEICPSLADEVRNWSSGQSR